jgi:hypothetical protein
MLRKLFFSHSALSSKPYAAFSTMITVAINATSEGTLSNLCFCGSRGPCLSSGGAKDECRVNGSDRTGPRRFASAYNVAVSKSAYNQPQAFHHFAEYGGEANIRVPPIARTTRHRIGAVLHSGVEIPYKRSIFRDSRDASAWMARGVGAY